MALSDPDLLHAAQSGGVNADQARLEFLDRFGRLLLHFANRACTLYDVDLSEAKDVVQRALASIFNPKLARFDPARAEGCLPYLKGMVQNAARVHTSFIRRGDDRRHDWSDPANADRNRPTSLDAIPEPRDNRGEAETRELAGAVLALADPGERDLIDRVFFRGQTTEEAAVAVGVDRSTVSRRLTRFYGKVRSRVSLFSAAGAG